MGVSREEVLMLSFLLRLCYPDMWITAFLAELQDGRQQMSYVPSVSRYNTHFLFPIPLSFFISFISRFVSVPFSIYYHM